MAADRVVAADVVGCSADGTEQRSLADRKKSRGGFRPPEPNPGIDLQEAKRFQRRSNAQVCAAGTERLCARRLPLCRRDSPVLFWAAAFSEAIEVIVLDGIRR